MEMKEEVQNYYGDTLKSSADLKTNACCTDISMPKYIKDTLKQIHPEVLEKYYGCGLTIPLELKDLSVLDLGCGAGRDCFILSKLVGQNGNVIGVDMTDNQLNVAKKHEAFHQNLFGYQKSNTSFLKGELEHLKDLNLEASSIDLIVSNCVINLTTDKEAVLRDAYRLLKNGGEMYFSDVYADRRIPKHLTMDPVLYGECLSGALYWNDFQNLAKKVGFLDPRKVEISTITVNDKTTEEKLGPIKFYSITYRLFKLDGLEPECEDYGQKITYKGTLSESPDSFFLDSGHIFLKNQEQKVCGNTFLMLKNSRLSKHFEFSGNFENHLGIFEDCGGISIASQNSEKKSCC